MGAAFGGAGGGARQLRNTPDLSRTRCVFNHSTGSVAMGIKTFDGAVLPESESVCTPGLLPQAGASAQALAVAGS